MLANFSLVLVILTSVLQRGVVFDCSNWTAGARTHVIISVTTDTGAINKGEFKIAPTAETLDAQLGVWAVLEDEPGWVVKRGSNHTVVVFGPKGESIKSVKIESDGWKPKVRPILGPPIPKK